MMSPSRRLLGSALLFVHLYACSEPYRPPTSAAPLRVIPLNTDEWWVSWHDGSRPQIDHVEISEKPPLRVDGRRSHTLEIAGHSIHLPRRVTDSCAHTRFVVLGDGRAHVGDVGPSAYWVAMLHEVATHRPQFILNTGDLVKNGNRQNEWDNYLALTPVWPPVIPVRGNHDRGGLFEKLQLNPGPVFWFQSGPVAIIGVDTEVSNVRKASVLRDLDQTLHGISSPWRLVFLHRPVYSRGRHGSDERGWNQDLIPLFQKHRVDLVVSGHDHNYERFCRQSGMNTLRKCSSHGGTVYLVSGGAATFTTPVPGLSRTGSDSSRALDTRTSTVFSNAHHFVRIDASPTRMTVRGFRTRAGNLRPPGQFDEFTFRRIDAKCRR